MDVNRPSRLRMYVLEPQTNKVNLNWVSVDSTSSSEVTSPHIYLDYRTVRVTYIRFIGTVQGLSWINEGRVLWLKLLKILKMSQTECV